jgi:SAM-dependent methyltransferase
VPSSPPDERSHAVYGRNTLRVYDLWVHGLSNPLAWRCPTSRLEAWYDDHVGRRHLEVGVGTGYFMDRAGLPPTASVTLLDPNPACLEAASRRVRRLDTRCVRGDVLRPLDLEPASVDSIALMYVLHCLPGSLVEKARAFAHLAPSLAPGGVLFGATILGRGVRPNAIARALLALYNARGVFDNLEDDREGLLAALEHHFEDVTLENRGLVALFAARGPR